MKWLNELIGGGLAVLGGSNPVGGVLAVLAGVPMYADIFGTIPAAEALLYKGAQIAACGVMTPPALVVDGQNPEEGGGESIDS